MATCFFATWLSFAAETNKNAIIPPPRREVPGRHDVLKSGAFYIPDFFHAPTNGLVDVVLFFHGAAWCAEQNFYDARKNGVMVTVNFNNGETVISNAEAFDRILAEIVAQLESDGIHSVGRICLASFSGGYVAVRSILQQPKLAGRISDVVLADSLYAGKVKGKTNELDPEQMASFLDFARRAADGKATFIFSQLYPPEEKYRDNTTTLAAYYLTDHLQVERKPATGHNAAGATLLYSAEKGNFHVFGYAGMNNQDHFNHFYGISDLFRQTSLETVPRPDPAKMPIPALTWPQVKTLLASNSIVLVDARSPDEFRAGHIPGAISLALTEFNKSVGDFEAKYPKFTRLVVYCSSPSCETAHWETEALMGAHGFVDVRLMPGGYEEYTRSEHNAGEPSK